MAKYTINGQEVTEDYFKQYCTHQGEINYLVFPLLSPPKKEGNNKKLHHIATIKVGKDNIAEKISEGFKNVEKSKIPCWKEVVQETTVKDHQEKYRADIIESNAKQYEYDRPFFELLHAISLGEKDTSNHGTLGKKESEGKLPLELDFDFIKQMAERMSANKANSKYKKWNWKNSIEVEKLLEACMRHMFEIMEGRYEDDSREFGHLEAVATGMMMVNYQLKNLHNKK